MKKRKRKCGGAFCFHGSFSSKAKAAAKEKTRKGSFIISRKVRGLAGLRYIVMTPKR